MAAGSFQLYEVKARHRIGPRKLGAAPRLFYGELAAGAAHDVVCRYGVHELEAVAKRVSRAHHRRNLRVSKGQPRGTSTGSMAEIPDSLMSTGVPSNQRTVARINAKVHFRPEAGTPASVYQFVSLPGWRGLCDSTLPSGPETVRRLPTVDS